MSGEAMIAMPGTSYRGELPPADEALLSLAAELGQDVARLAVDIGERNLKNCPQQLAQAADFIAAQFRAAGHDIRWQEYKVAGTSCYNLDAEILGAARHEEIFVVGAHYDTVPGTVGANDNTSGVAATRLGETCPPLVQKQLAASDPPSCGGRYGVNESWFEVSGQVRQRWIQGAP